MRKLLLILLLVSSFTAFSQKKEKLHIQEVKIDTTTIVINPLQTARLSELDARKKQLLNKILEEEGLIMRVILESNNVNPAFIDGDSLSLSFGDRKILVIRRKNKK